MPFIEEDKPNLFPGVSVIASDGAIGILRTYHISQLTYWS